MLKKVIITLAAMQTTNAQCAGANF